MSAPPLEVSQETRHHAPRARTVGILVLAVMAGASGDLLLSHGMKQIGTVTLADILHLHSLILRIVGTHTILAGVACMAGFFALYLVALSWADLSFVLPITGLSFVVVTLCAQLIFHEHVTAMRWAGVVLILAGVVNISRS